MPHVTATITIAMPLPEVFGYVDDWRNSTAFTQDLQVWEPAGEVTHGLGSTFRSVLKLGPTAQESTLEITSWEQDGVIGWDPVSGLAQRGSYRFAAVGDGTEVVLDIDIKLPGGIAGRLLGKTMEPLAKITVTKTLENLKRILEG